MGNSTAYPGRDAAAEDVTNIRTADLKMVLMPSAQDVSNSFANSALGCSITSCLWSVAHLSAF